MDSLLSPPFAFLIYALLVSILFGMGRLLAGPANPSAEKSSSYASGEKSMRDAAVPGYRPFFKVALFFAVLHLGVVVLGSGDVSAGSALYVAGLLVALVALILG
jgi:NADH:ubiquinone oxidoreductase subunit 3 (subunit A)